MLPLRPPGETADPVRMYLKEIGRIPLLTREEEVSTAKEIQDGQHEVRVALFSLEAARSYVIQLGEALRAGEVDVARIYDLYKNGNIFDRVPYVLAPAIKSIVAQQVDPRIAADLKAFDFHKVVDNSTVERLVKEGYFEKVFGDEVKAEEQRKAKIKF